MTQGDLYDHFSRIILAYRDEENWLKADFTARQLQEILGNFQAVLLDQIKRAPCDHDGSRWTNRGKTFCGICSREVEG